MDYKEALKTIFSLAKKESRQRGHKKEENKAVEVKQVKKEKVQRDKKDKKVKKAKKAKKVIITPSIEVDDETKHLIERINQIYVDNGVTRECEKPLESYPTEVLRTHLNRLQWGHLDYITRNNVFPEPDELPVGGFLCDRGVHRVWTSPFFCELRRKYTCLYPACEGCNDWRLREVENGSESSANS